MWRAQQRVTSLFLIISQDITMKILSSTETVTIEFHILRVSATPHVCLRHKSLDRANTWPVQWLPVRRAK